MKNLRFKNIRCPFLNTGPDYVYVLVYLYKYLDVIEVGCGHQQHIGSHSFVRFIIVLLRGSFSRQKEPPAVHVAPHTRLVGHVTRVLYTNGRSDFLVVFRPVQMLHAAELVYGFHPHGRVTLLRQLAAAVGHFSAVRTHVQFRVLNGCPFIFHR